jgi:hypothetical protein
VLCSGNFLHLLANLGLNSTVGLKHLLEQPILCKEITYVSFTFMNRKLCSTITFSQIIYTFTVSLIARIMFTENHRRFFGCSMDIPHLKFSWGQTFPPEHTS